LPAIEEIDLNKNKIEKLDEQEMGNLSEKIEKID
jgi:hypothetical protein